MPGNNSPLRFGTSISVSMVRVAASNAPLVRSTLPTNVRPGYSATAIATGEPTAMSRPHIRWQGAAHQRSEEHTSELQSLRHLVCRLLLEKKKKLIYYSVRSDS